ncbi:hypothetical protein EU245_01625 [Lentibacillus lipolyticus]|nr:hypothetical protein EU245_01625 [Lentibacillus lipolyticus]
MNTEINLLERKPHKYTAPVIATAVFLLLAAVMAGVLVVQKHVYTEEIANQEHDLQELKASVTDHRKAGADERELQKLHQAITSIKANAVPASALYQRVLDYLPTSDRLIAYEFHGDHTFVVEARFSSLNAAADYVTILSDESYITDAELTGIDGRESSYQAVLTLRLDKDKLQREFGEHE